MRLSLGFPLSVAVRTDTGLVRSNNEDSFGSSWLDDGSLFVMVADGMGGHAAGEVASKLAVDVVTTRVSEDTSRDPRARLFEAILEANKAIIAEGKRINQRGMGTTAIVSLIHGDRAFLGLVGDSRLFHIRHGHMVWRTLDHTRVQSLLDRGIIREDEARSHPDAGMLTRALGHAKMSNGTPLEPEVMQDPLELEAGDVLVLCSDGLHDLVDDWEIAMAVAGDTPEDAADELVSLALKRGGHDNVTVAVIVAGERGSRYDPSFASDDPPTLPTADLMVTRGGIPASAEVVPMPTTPEAAPRAEVVAPSGHEAMASTQPPASTLPARPSTPPPPSGGDGEGWTPPEAVDQAASGGWARDQWIWMAAAMSFVALLVIFVMVLLVMAINGS